MKTKWHVGQPSSQAAGGAATRCLFPAKQSLSSVHPPGWSPEDGGCVLHLVTRMQEGGTDDSIPHAGHDAMERPSSSSRSRSAGESTQPPDLQWWERTRTRAHCLGGHMDGMTERQWASTTQTLASLRGSSATQLGREHTSA